MNHVSFVEFIDWKEIPIRYKPKWWDRPRWWLVRALGGECPLDTVKIVRVPIDGKDFMNKLFKQKRELFETFHRKPETLLIGGEDYEQLMDSPAAKTMFSFLSSIHFCNHEIFGLKVQVIPWMRGMVVMP